MKDKKCLACGHNLFKEPLLRYENMPSSAQSLPKKEALGSDRGIVLVVCQCSGCGLVQLANKPVPYYKEVIRATGFSKEMRTFRERQFREFIERHGLKDKKAIEIGCGKGENLSILKECGVRAYGLEDSQESVKHCSKIGLEAYRGFVDSQDYKIKGAPFDAFIMLGFLEHLPDPSTALLGIGNNLKEGAVGIIEVPNFDRSLEKNLFFEFMSDHLSYFTESTLRTTLALNGFDVIKCSLVWHENLIHAVVKKRSRLALSGYPEYRENLKAQIKKFIRRFGHGKVALWGAGHYALAIISLSGIEKDIRYVVDSAPFKQGRYTPATHIPIVPPETLDSDPVEAVIVMAAGYSDEVASIIRKKYAGRLKIAIVDDVFLKEIS